MHQLHVGTFSRLLHLFEPGDLIAIEALYRVGNDETNQEKRGLVYSTVLTRTTEYIFLSTLKLDVRETTTEIGAKYAIGSSVLNFYEGTLDILHLESRKPILLFKKLHLDISNDFLQQLSVPSTFAN